ncbi:MAG: polysaccharide pyruvyl transferase family protein [Burkholderiales bacterium]
MKIGLIDPGIFSLSNRSPNIGDHIISRAVHRELRAIFGESTDIVSISSHQYPRPEMLKRLRGADHVFVGGSNLLWFRWLFPASWKIGPLGLAFYRDLILFGVGWGAYNIKPNAYGQWLCSVILSRVYTHSVRDEFTCNIANRELQIAKVSNTSCPTMWCLTEELMDSIHHDKGDECIFALTDYAKDPRLDRQLIQDLNERYGGHLLFWPQGEGDIAYCRSLGYKGRVIGRSLNALLDVLSSGVHLDYVGTRLHAGILCLEHSVRSLIIRIDNRANEIADDTGIPSIARNDRAAMLAWLEGDTTTRIRLPMNEIRRWQDQFRVKIPSPAVA